MFENVPNNLPVEPLPPTAPAADPTPSPMKPPAVPMPPMAKSGKKEPEDIFSGLDQAPVASGESPMPELEDHPSRGGGLKIVAIVFGGIAALALVGAAVWMLFLREPAPATPIVNQPVTPSPEEENIEQPPVLEQQPVTQAPSGVNIPAPEPVVQTPPTIPEPVPVGPPTEAPDLDQDKLSDGEEAFYGTDGGNRDSDGDGFADGDEVQGLYSPVTANRLLLAEGFMTPERFNGWSFSFPRPWSLVIETTNRGSITSGSAARFLLETRRRVIGQSLSALAAELHPGHVVKTFTTKNGLEAAQTDDGLLTILAQGDDLLIVTYDLNGERMYEYRTSYAMFLNSVQR
jgi:hypothetical protein